MKRRGEGEEEERMIEEKRKEESREGRERRIEDRLGRKIDLKNGRV